MKDKVTTALFAFFLGGLGAHQFYLGNPGKGIFYLLFIWTFIPSIIAFIEFFIFLSMSIEEFDAKYNKGKTRQTYHVTNTPNPVDNSAEIQKLYDLKQKGIITEYEFRQYRKRWL